MEIRLPRNLRELPTSCSRCKHGNSRVETLPDPEELEQMMTLIVEREVYRMQLPNMIIKTSVESEQGLLLFLFREHNRLLRHPGHAARHFLSDWWHVGSLRP